MKKIKRRALALFLVVALLGGGTTVFALQYLAFGGTWAASFVSRAVWSGGTVARGTILDRDGVTLLDMRDGTRVYAADEATRRSTLHAVGDAQGNIGTAALTVFAPELVGWNPVTGLNASSRGGTVTLSISVELHKAALSALGNRRGAVVILDYTTGEILCAASSPTFDPANPPDADGISALEGVYLNRALSATYTPGSTFKIVTAATAIEQIPDIFDRTFHCGGQIEIGGGTVTCPSNHGDMTFRDAFAHSCNVTFAQLALEVGSQAIYDCAARLGLLSNLDADGASTAAGRYSRYASEFDTAWSGVGQSDDLVSPVAMARLCAAIANGGRAPALHLLKNNRTTKYERIMSVETAEKLLDLMTYTVDSYYGGNSFPGFTLGAKSGTAEVGSDSPHAWFVGFSADAEKPYAFAVIVENGGAGRTVAGEVVSKVLSVIQ